MPSDQNPSDQDIEKMLEQARVKTVPPEILKGFKEDVMRRVAAERRTKPGIWTSPGWKLPRIGMTAGAGALACLFIVSIAVFTTRMPDPKPEVHPTGLASTRPAAFQVASLPTAGALNAPMDAVRMSAVALTPADPARPMSARSSAVQPVGPAAAPARKLTVEEELRLIEEFDDRRFFIRQDITDDALAAA